MSNFEFTDKAQQSLAAAIQLAKDYANAQAHPVHLAFVLLNEGAGDDNQKHSLFASVVQKAGGEPVRVHVFTSVFVQLHADSALYPATRQSRSSEADSAPSDARPSPR